MCVIGFTAVFSDYTSGVIDNSVKSITGLSDLLRSENCSPRKLFAGPLKKVYVLVCLSVKTN